MRTIRLLMLAAWVLLPAVAQYQYDFPHLLNPYASSQWTANGTISASNNMVTSSSSGPLIFSTTIPGPNNEYEVRTTLALASSGGNYNTYLRATSHSLSSAGTGQCLYASRLTQRKQ